jgi:hypothetical protein
MQLTLISRLSVFLPHLILTRRIHSVNGGSQYKCFYVAGYGLRLLNPDGKEEGTNGNRGIKRNKRR